MEKSKSKIIVIDYSLNEEATQRRILVKAGEEYPMEKLYKVISDDCKKHLMHLDMITYHTEN